MNEFVYSSVVMICLMSSVVICYLVIKNGVLKDGVTNRSSHDRAVPRAGGIAIMLPFLIAATIWLALVDVIKSEGIFWLLGLTSAATVLGLADDIRPLRPALKFAGQFVLAILTVILVGAIQSIPLPFLGDVPLGMFGGIITVVWIVAFINVFNFMDGLNAIAAGAAIVALLGMAVVSPELGRMEIWILCYCLAATLFGFLAFNMGGQVFMGDAGSHGLGFFLAALAVLASLPAEGEAGTVSVIFLPVIFLPFIYDVTLTLVHRALRGKPIHKPHKEHIYQQMHQRGFSHVQVSSIYTALCFASAVIAILMLDAPAERQWLGPFMLVCFFAAGTLVFYRAGKKAGSGRAGN